MSKIELLAKIELLNKYEAMMEEMKSQADAIRNEIKAEMDAHDLEEMIAGQYIIRYTSVLSNRFDSTAFKRVMPEIYKAYTKQVSSSKPCSLKHKPGIPLPYWRFPALPEARSSFVRSSTLCGRSTCAL